jgi:hypothetical protein
MRIICRNINRRCLDIAVPYLFVKRDFHETESAIFVGIMTRVMIPFQIDLPGCEDMSAAVVDAHSHDLIFKDERTVRYPGQP